MIPNLYPDGAKDGGRANSYVIPDFQQGILTYNKIAGLWPADHIEIFAVMKSKVFAESARAVQVGIDNRYSHTLKIEMELYSIQEKFYQGNYIAESSVNA
jgi:hypothetical protein